MFDLRVGGGVGTIHSPRQSIVTSLMTGLSFVAIQYSSPSGKMTVPPLLHSVKAERMFSVSSSLWPLGVTVQVL